MIQRAIDSMSIKDWIDIQSRQKLHQTPYYIKNQQQSINSLENEINQNSSGEVYRTESTFLSKK